MAPSRMSRSVRGMELVTSFDAERACFMDRPIATPHFCADPARIREAKAEETLPEATLNPKGETPC